MKDSGNSMNVIIIGTVAAGIKAAAKLKRLNPELLISSSDSNEIMS